MTVKIPDNGNTWIGDASIDTVAWLNATLGKDLSDEMYNEIPEDQCPTWDGGDQSDGYGRSVNSGEEIAKWINKREGCMDRGYGEYVEISRDNVCNNENDFSEVFTFTVYAPVGTDEWYYADNVYIATCLHRGGDVRGNYDGPEIRRADCPAESGFLDWVLGWTVDGEGIEDSEIESEEFSPGYSSNPGCHLTEKYGDKGEWRDESFHFADKDGIPTGVHATPYNYAEF